MDGRTQEPVADWMKEQFGLFTQIYRRNGYSWVETAGTDELSLDELNEIGKKSVLNFVIIYG
jgi:hypothetical protein